MEIHVFPLGALCDGLHLGPVVAADAAVLVKDVVEILDLDLAVRS